VRKLAEGRGKVEQAGSGERIKPKSRKKDSLKKPREGGPRGDTAENGKVLTEDRVGVPQVRRKEDESTQTVGSYTLKEIRGTGVTASRKKKGTYGQVKPFHGHGLHPF